MRRIRHFVASAGLGAGLFSSAAVLSVTVGTAALVAGTGTPVQAAVADSGGASATADPASATPGSSVTFQVFCTSLTASSATFFGTTLGLPQQIPMDKESGGGVFSVTVTLPGNILPGVYHPDIDCSDGSSASARIKVTPFPSLPEVSSCAVKAADPLVLTLPVVGATWVIVTAVTVRV